MLKFSVAHQSASWTHNRLVNKVTGTLGPAMPRCDKHARFNLGSIERLEEKWFWPVCDTTKTT